MKDTTAARRLIDTCYSADKTLTHLLLMQNNMQ